ncbi:hypothetical protein HU200_036882 [Digitaria exilis]|uniref:NAC domain-containing protein n=1 Tax=Digitaria exilis TaxID=1010633 RepID=A0A835BEJ9_9POAL|nr:hypothetical protein HU200_036882 [Digitaria exilis]
MDLPRARRTQTESDCVPVSVSRKKRFEPANNQQPLITSRLVVDRHSHRTTMVVTTRAKTEPRPRPPPPDLSSHPYEEELITRFLRPRAAASTTTDHPCASASFVHDADVYSACPDELTSRNNGDDDGAWYFLSAVRAKTRDGQRKARTVDTGEGCWHSEAGAKPVVDETGWLLGHRQSFSFVTKVDGGRVRSGWLMVELSLDADDDVDENATDMVLCKIYFSPRARLNGRGAPTSSSAAGRKRKAAVDDKKNPTLSRQRRRRVDDTTSDAEEKDRNKGGEMANDEEEELWADDSSFSWWMRNMDQLMKEYNIVDRPDEEIQKTHGVYEYMKFLNRDYGSSSCPKVQDDEDYFQNRTPAATALNFRVTYAVPWHRKKRNAGRCSDPDASTGSHSIFFSNSDSSPLPDLSVSPNQGHSTAAAAATAMVRSPSAANKSPSAAFQSHPTDLELVNSYLRPWVETGLKAGPFIHEADVYAADPADLTRRFAPAVAQDGEKAWYFFTPLRHKSVRGKRKARTVATGGGCWHNEAKSKPVCTRLNGKVQIGHRQSFSFVNKEGGQRVRTGWLMMELRLLREGAGERAQAEDAVGNLVLCKVYRSPRNPEPPVDRDHGLKVEAADGDDESSGATEEEDDSSDEPQATAAAVASGLKKKSEDEESSEATVAAPSRHSKAGDEISGAAAAPGRKEKAAGDEDSAETSAAAPARKRKAPEDENSGAAAAEAATPAPKRTASGSSSPGAAPAPASTEMQCPNCGIHLAVTLKRPETKSETEIAKGEPAPGTSDALPQGGDSRGSSEKDVRFHQFL